MKSLVEYVGGSYSIPPCVQGIGAAMTQAVGMFPGGAPTAAPTQPPVTQPPVPVGPATSFDDGTFVVGADVAAGTYRAPGDPSGGCYWERLSGFGGTVGEIIANDIKPGSAVVTIAPSDAGFHSSGCGTWTQNLAAITSSPAAPFGDGTFIVGTDVSAATWRSDGASSCYWERESGFGGTTGNIIANNFGSGAQVVTISTSDVGFQSDGCGNWTKVR
jgi:hypothetical protein